MHAGCGGPARDRHAVSTLSGRIGRRWAHYGYVGLVLGAYIILALVLLFSAYFVKKLRDAQSAS